jgi:hypothetical protein
MSGGWLLCIPKDEHSTISQQVFRLCCKMRLGMDLPIVPSYCPACKDRIEPNGSHFFSCNSFRQFLTHRHDAILRDFKALASSAGVVTHDKNLTIFRAFNENDLQRPDLLLEKEGVNGRDLYLDITVSHPTCPSYVRNGTGKERGYTIRKKIKTKNDKYKEKCERQGLCFSPIVSESFGLASREVIQLISRLAEKSSELSDIPFELEFSYWKKRISTTLQVGTAKFIMEASTSAINQRKIRMDIEENVLLESYHVRPKQ